MTNFSVGKKNKYRTVPIFHTDSYLPNRFTGKIRHKVMPKK
jgi:hypothetical protein